MNQEEISLKIEIWNHHHSLFGKTMENNNDKTKSAKTRFWIQESVTRREGISNLLRPSKGHTYN